MQYSINHYQVAINFICEILNHIPYRLVMFRVEMTKKNAVAI